MKLGYSHLNLIGSVLMLTAFVMMYAYETKTLVPLILLVASLIISIILIVQRKQFEEEIKPDERTRKIGTSALSYA
ncbi:MAG: hypothetical protein WC391_04485 [Methanoregula sp.]